MTVSEAEFASLSNDINTMWLILGGTMVVFMQCGFAMLEVGSVSVKNTKNILIKNIGDAVVGAISFWLLGYGFAFGESAGRFIGTDNFALKGSQFESEDGAMTKGYNYSFWFFQFAFAATASTIVSGAVAERVSFNAYIVYSFFITSFIYPVVVHWGWSSGGWASAFAGDNLLFDCGLVDFAGSGVVHMTGGIASLVAAYVVGPRSGRFGPDGIVNPLPEQSAVLQTLGTLILWVGWYFFNACSTLVLVNASGIAATTVVNTTISAAFGALSTVVLAKMDMGYWDSGAANNGVLAGLVGITAGCSVTNPEGSMVIGIVSGVVYTYSSKLLLKLRVDDVVGAFSVHGACGCWGVISSSLFATKENYALAYYGEPDKCAGVFYGGSGYALLANFLFVLAVIAWTGATCMVLFFALDATIGMRVSREDERIGLDDSKHGGETYPEFNREVAPI